MRLSSCAAFVPRFFAVSCVATVALLLAFSLIAQAAGTGQIAGTVVDERTGRPIAGVSIRARSASDRYQTVTDAKGHFAISGITVDTYVLSIEAPGYDTFTIAGATVTQDETYQLPIKLEKHIRTIGRTQARSITSAYQPDQTIDRTVVNAQGIDQLLGKSFNTNGKQLLSELPGVAIDKNGTVLVRGGTSFEGALEVEGIDYTEPNRSLSSRFENAGSNYLLNGVGSIEIIPGSGDATRGNTGTGLIALTAKRGATPAFGTFDYEQTTLGGGNQSNQTGFEYGFAAFKNRLSNYLTYIGENQHYSYGPYGTDAAAIIADPANINPDLQSLYTANQRSLYQTAVSNRSVQSSRDFLDNLVYKFGPGQSEQVQFFIQSQALHQDLDYGGIASVTAVPQAIFDQLNYSQQSRSLTFLAAPATAAAFVSAFAPQTIGAVAGAPLTNPETIDSPFSAYKFEYDNNLNATTSLQFRAYRTDNSASEAVPSQGLFVPQEGGTRRGFATDITKLAGGTMHAFRLGGKFEYADPYGSRIDTIDYTGVFSGLYYANSQGSFQNVGPYTHDILADFMTPLPALTFSNTGGAITAAAGTPGCIGSPTVPIAAGTVGSVAPPQEHCGYLSTFFPNGAPPLPAQVEVPLAHQQSYGLYVQDTYAPNSRLHILAGLRLDGYNFQLPSDPANPPAVNGIRHQRLYQPKLGVSYRLSSRDALRANFGRSLSIPLPTFLGTDISRQSLAAFANIPSYDSVTGKAATYCGVPSLVSLPGYSSAVNGEGPVFLGHQTCSSYADQLYWLLRDARFSQQEQITSPLRGATFTNYDFTYSHEFPGGTALKLTPFYRRGYDVVETSQTLLGIDPSFGTQILSPEVESNLGVQTAAGLEFVATTPQRPFGWSATATATYINQIGNDPPGNYLPTASVLLGELYHSPTIAPLQATLAATYRTKWGLRVNPVFTFKSGYPYGAGVYQALTINGTSYYVPYTNAVYQGFYSSLIANANVDPQFPGTIANPNIVAYRGTEAATAAPGSLRSSAYVNLDLTVELTPPLGRGGLTYGIAITNIFDRTAAVPVPNYAYDCTLIYTGLCAGSGFPAISNSTHHAPQTVNAGSSPYLVYFNGAPINVRFFVQAHL